MKSFLLILIACICWSLASAQKRNSVQVSLSYPWVANGAGYTLFNLAQVNAGYNYSVSKHFALGGNYGVSIHGATYSYTDNNTMVTFKLVDYLHNFDGGVRWLVNPDDGYRLSVDLSAGLTLYNERSKGEYGSGSADTHAGYNVNPSLQLNRTLCNGFDIFLRSGYCLTVLYKQPVHIISAGLGTSFSF